MRAEAAALGLTLTGRRLRHARREVEEWTGRFAHESRIRDLHRGNGFWSSVMQFKTENAYHRLVKWAVTLAHKCTYLHIVTNSENLQDQIRCNGVDITGIISLDQVRQGETSKNNRNATSKNDFIPSGLRITHADSLTRHSWWVSCCWSSLAMSSAYSSTLKSG